MDPQLTQTAMRSGTGSATLPSVLKRVLLTILSTCFSVVQEGFSGPPVDTDSHEVRYRLCDSALSAEESVIDAYPGISAGLWGAVPLCASAT